MSLPSSSSSKTQERQRLCWQVSQQEVQQRLRQCSLHLKDSPLNPYFCPER